MNTQLDQGSTFKLDIGAGYSKKEGFIAIDIADHGATDIVMDIEKERLPFEDNSVDEIRCYEVLEHIGFSRDNPDNVEALVFVMNEMWRVMKPNGLLHGKVPRFNGAGSWGDPTHKRQFHPDTWQYFTGTNEKYPNQPVRPRNANYGIKPWHLLSLNEKNEFRLTPRKHE